MGDERGHRKLSKTTHSGLSGAAGILDDWLDDLERFGNGLLGAGGRAQLLEEFSECAADRESYSPSDDLWAGCSCSDLAEAARALEKRALSSLCSGELGDGADEAAMAFASALQRAARRTAAAAAPCDTPAFHPATEAETMWKASGDIHAADGASEVIRVLVEWAARVSDAEGVVWWEQERDGGRLVARRAIGVRLTGQARVIRPSEEFWRQNPQTGETSPVVALSAEREDHAAFLTRVGATGGLVVRAHDGERWVGALSVHRGDLPHHAVCSLVALTQQAAAALRAQDVEERRRQLAEGHRICIAELGHALASALDLKGLLAAICRLALRTTGADACYLLLSDDQGPPMLRMARDERRSTLTLNATTLSAVVELTSAIPPDQPWWQPGAEDAELIRNLQEAGARSLLGLRLPIHGEPLGTIILIGEGENALAALDRELAAAFAAQSAVAIENLQLFEEMQRRLLEMTDLTWMSTHIAALLDASRISSIVAEGAARALSAPRAAILLADGRNGLFPVPASCLALPEEASALPPEAKHVGTEALEARGPMAIADAELEGSSEDALVRWLGARSLLCAPMLTQQGLRGVLVVGDTRPHRFPTHAKALLAAYANQGALALQSALLYQDVVRHLDDLSKLSELSQKLGASPDLKEALHEVLRYASEMVDAPRGMLMLYDQGTRELVVKATHGFPPDASIESDVRFKPGEGMIGKAAQCGAVLTSADSLRDGRVRYREIARREGLRAAICAPLMARGRAVGVLSLYRPIPGEFTGEEKRLVAAIANSAALAVENAYLHNEAQERSQFLAALMGEINHRVRNSLQSVAGLLRMELKRPRRLSTEQAIKRGIAHIQTVAVVHELMPTREFQFVDLKQVARRVINLTSQAVLVSGMPARPAVSTQVSGARVMLPSQKATSLAIILNELVDNALRHGLTNAKHGRLAISLAEAGGEVVVQIKDNGVGLPAGFDLPSSPGLGLSIAKGVAERDLGGTLELEGNAGLTVRIRFPK